MSAVNELRDAAKTLRDLAESCEQAPWTVESDGKGNAWINLPAYHHAWGMHGFPEEAYYVATMHPGVALALAELIEAALSYVSLPRWEDYPIAVKALAVARAINGDTR